MAIATGPVSPYITPGQLKTAPTGISWQTVPDQRASDAEKYDALVNICQTATGMVDTRCGQVIRSTQQTETLYGPGSFRVTTNKNGTVRLLLSQVPVTAVTAIQVASASSFPYQWSSVPTGMWAVERPALTMSNTTVAADAGTGGQAVILAPGYVSWLAGRGGYVIEVTYNAGWPHAGLTQTASTGDVTLEVDDCTGWTPVTSSGAGAGGVLRDNSGNQEAVSVLVGSAQTGPGTLSLAAPLLYGHDPGVLVTTLPDQIQWAAILYGASQALTRGATATTIQTVGPRPQSTASGDASLKAQADALLTPFRRVI